MKAESKNILKGCNHLYFDSKVVTRNIITDWVQGIRNMLGLELKSYTNIINQTVKELQENCNVKLKWYRIDIEELHGGILISLYGEKTRK